MQEKRLKDYCGCQVWKCRGADGQIFYMACTYDNDCINIFKTLKELKDADYIKTYYS